MCVCVCELSVVVVVIVVNVYNTHISTYCQTTRVRIFAHLPVRVYNK